MRILGLNKIINIYLLIDSVIVVENNKNVFFYN